PVALGGALEVRSRPAQLAALLATAAILAAMVVVVIWGFYDFRYTLFRAPDDGHASLDWDGVLRAAGSFRPALGAGRHHRLLPEAYLYGVAYMTQHAATRPAFLNGAHSWIGWRSYFPYCAAVKTPICLIGLVVAGAAGATVGPMERLRENLYRTAPLW